MQRVLKGGGFGILTAATLWSCSKFAADHSALPPDQGEQGFGPFQTEAGRLVTESSKIPETFQEAPMLADLVTKGRLPPVGERIGTDPIVLEPLHEIGQYGGTLRRAFVGPGDNWGITRFASGPDSFLYWDKDWKSVRPNVAREFEVSRDGRILTIFLRRGMRWSDGVPFTADDVMFWYEELYLDRRIVPGPSPSLMVDNEEVLIEKVDDTTISFVAPKPFEVIVEMLASPTDIAGPSMYGRTGMGGFAPRHYLSQFHPKYSSESEVKTLAREAGFANWSIFLKKRNDWTLNTDLPVVSPWRVVSPINTQKFRLERNPYSVWVDTAGNQLPYIDRISNLLCSSPDTVNFKAVAGQLDFQNRHLDISQLPFLLRNRKRSGYNVFLDPNEGTDLGLRINLSHRIDPEIGGWLGSPTFRRALSLAVDRDEINETLMLGLGQPTASVPASGNRYYPGPEWSSRWATHDVAEANRLLDGLGLTKKDSEGFRLRKDGAGRLRLNCMATVSHFDYAAVAEMVREQWKAIAIDLDVQIVDPALFHQRSISGEAQLAVQITGTEDPFVFPDLLFPYSTVGFGAIMGIDFGKWFRSYGKKGIRPPNEIVEMINLWRIGRTVAREERIRIGIELIRRHVDLVLSIGVLSAAYGQHAIHLVKKDLGNVPRRMLNSPMIMSPLNALPMTFFFRNQDT